MAATDLLEHDRALGCRFVIGCDEAGRGALAGPLVAVAVLLDLATLQDGDLQGVDDSKRLRPARRAQLVPQIERAAVRIQIELVSNTDIDAYGIQQANFGAMGRALEAAAAGVPERHRVCLVDGIVAARTDLVHRTLKGGDALSATISCASIIAKEHRDLIMRGAGTTWPGWGMEQHMGYGSAAHREAIRRLGPSPLHRLSFLTRILPG